MPRPSAKPAALAQLRRSRAQMMRDATSPLAGTVLGRLRLDEAITVAQLAAGAAFAECTGRHDRLRGLQPRTARSPSYQLGAARTGGGDLADADMLAELERAGGDFDEAARQHPRLSAILAATRRYQAAGAALRRAGREADDLVRTVCLLDLPVMPAELQALRAGLDALAQHFAIRGGREGTGV